MNIVYTDREKCRGCYACVRNCVAKAIRVREGLAEVIEVGVGMGVGWTPMPQAAPYPTGPLSEIGGLKGQVQVI